MAKLINFPFHPLKISNEIRLVATNAVMKGFTENHKPSQKVWVYHRTLHRETFSHYLDSLYKKTPLTHRVKYGPLCNEGRISRSIGTNSVQ